MWSFEQTCSNEIEIRLNGERIASIISDDEENSQSDFEHAKFIVEACNQKEP